MTDAGRRRRSGGFVDPRLVDGSIDGAAVLGTGSFMMNPRASLLKGAVRGNNASISLAAGSHMLAPATHVRTPSARPTSTQTGRLHTPALGPQMSSMRMNSPSAMGISSPSAAAGGSSPSATLYTKLLADGKPSSTALAIDPLLPSALADTRPVWQWLLANAFVFAIYNAAFAVAGATLPTPGWKDSSSKLAIIGWLFHLVGASLFVGVNIALIVRRSPLHSGPLVVYLLSLVAFVVGSVLHTTNLGVVDPVSAGVSAGNSTSSSSTSASSSPSLTSSLGSGEGQASLSLQLQWVAALAFYALLTVMVWKAPASSANIASPDELAKHKLLMELRQLSEFNSDLTRQVEEEEAAQLAYQRAGPSARGGADILTLDRQNTRGSPVPPSRDGERSRPRTGQVMDSSELDVAPAALPLTEEEEEQHQRMIRVQEVQRALEQEARELEA